MVNSGDSDAPCSASVTMEGGKQRLESESSSSDGLERLEPLDLDDLTSYAKRDL